MATRECSQPIRNSGLENTLLDVWSIYMLSFRKNERTPMFLVSSRKHLKTVKILKKYNHATFSVQLLIYISISGLCFPTIKLSMLYFFIIRSGVGFSTSSSP